MICNQNFRRTLKSLCCSANARGGGSLHSPRANVATNVATNVARDGTNAENSVLSLKTNVSTIFDTSL